MNKQIIDIALGEYGVAEITGQQDNPRVLDYFDASGFNGKKLKDETAWCSAFANWVAIQAGVSSSGKLNARSWLDVGQEVTSPEKGDVVIFWRGSPSDWRGHVAFFIRETANWVYVLGGNQGNRVSIKDYPKSRVLGYRRL